MLGKKTGKKNVNSRFEVQAAQNRNDSTRQVVCGLFSTAIGKTLEILP